MCTALSRAASVQEQCWGSDPSRAAGIFPILLANGVAAVGASQGGSGSKVLHFSILWGGPCVAAAGTG